jgi:hypothetical protein
LGSPALVARPHAPATVPSVPTPPESSPTVDPPFTRSQIHLESDTQAPASTLPEAPLEAPPPTPRHKGLVLESSLGALGFLGAFGHVAPTAPWYHAQLGYAVLPWLLFFGEGELAFTSTSLSEDESHSYSFPILGFGGGGRVTVHATPRVAFYLQGSIGVLEANVPTGALAVLGYKNAETFAPSFAVRVGVEWYQIDRHLALGLAVGARDATGFAKVDGSGGTGLMADASLAIRYTF